MKRREDLQPDEESRPDIGPEKADQVDIEPDEQGKPDYEAGNADIKPE